MPIKPFLEAGQITGTHGVRGEVRVMPWCDSPEVYARLHTLYWDEHGEQPVRVHSRAHKSMALTVIEGVDTVEKLPPCAGGSCGSGGRTCPCQTGGISCRI